MSDFSHAMMKAAVVRAFGQPLSIEEVPVAMPGPRQLLVRIVASGVCHTDVHGADGDWPARPRLPFIPGHEAVGDVVAMGDEVEDFAIGERVGVPWLYATCGHCEYCQSGRESLCPLQVDTGWQVNGGFAEYVVANVDYVARIPEELDPFVAAPVLGAGVAAYKGLKETETLPGQWVVISGIGGLGHLAVQYARAMGLRVIAVDVEWEKLTLAQECGAELCVDARRADAVMYVQQETGGAHAALVTADAPEAFGKALEMLRSGGTCVLLGMPASEVPMPVYPMVMRRLTVRGSIEGTRTDLAEALDFAARGLVRVTRDVRRLEEINDVFARLRAGQVRGRVVLDLRRQVPRGKARNEARELTTV
jgi:alcohol dehydrogenase, propanol-preferring